MANRAQQITPSGVMGFGAAGFLATLSLGSLVVVALNATGQATLSVADYAALRFTLSQALVSALVSTLLAIPIARALARRQFRGRNLLVTLLGAPFILPAIVAVLGLLAIYGRAGFVSDALQYIGIGRLNIYGFSGVVLAHVFFNLPLATRLYLQGWQAIPAEHFRLAAGLGMTTADIARHLERPMLRAILPGIFATIFLLCVTSFAVALTLGGGPRATTIELAIYQAFRFDFDLSKAALLAVLQFIICAVAAIAAWRLASPIRLGHGFDAPVRRWDCGSMAQVLGDAFVLTLTTLFLLSPLVMIALKGLAGLGDLTQPVYAAAFRSVILAVVSALIALGLALPLAQTIAKRGHFAGLLEGAGYLSLAASPMVIGTGLFIVLFPLIDPARLALPITALVNAALSLPFALRALIPAFRTTEREYGQLADSLGMQGWHRFRLMTWPRIRPAAGFAAGLAAALSMGDLGVVALFADPEGATLPLMLYRLMGSYQTEAAQGAALLLVSLSLILFWIFDRVGRLNVAP
ncbi:MAG: thiamine transport system permease protein [Paracoccaceae bacterium]|jgi:thiamine transport system permease protein